jgi:thiamine biosynthesis lipoprotein
MLTLACAAMRTRFEIVLADDADPARLQAAADEVFDEIARVEEQLSAYRATSELWELNEWAADGPVRTDPRLFRFLERAATLSHVTGGAFDLTVGPLLRCWGFASQKNGEQGSVPAAEDLAAARALVGMTRLVRLDSDEGAVTFLREGVRLDPGAIGKGYALERAADLLREVGVENALIHAGTSTVCALGAPHGMTGWKVAVQHPQRPDARLAVVTLRDRALSVSAVHGKSFHADGRRFGHVIDPRTGCPVERNVLAAVVAESPTDTDALSTALLVLGEPGLEVVGGYDPSASLLLAREGGDASDTDLEVSTRGDAFSPLE